MSEQHLLSCTKYKSEIQWFHVFSSLLIFPILINVWYSLVLEFVVNFCYINKCVMLIGAWICSRAPDKLRICIFYAMKTSKNVCIIRSECTFTHTYCCVSKLSKFGAYLYAVDNQIIHHVHKQYIFDFEKFPVITSLYTFRNRKCIHPRGTECLPF